MKFTDKHKITDTGNIFWYIFTAYAVSYIARKGYSTCMGEICAELALTKRFAGAISTGYLACYGTGQIFSGLIADRVDPKLMITAGLTGAGIMNILMGTANTGVALLVFWCLNGCFHSMLWSSVIRAIALWLPDSERDFAGVTIGITIPVGTMASYLISSVCLRFTTWRGTFFATGLSAVAGAVIWLSGCTHYRGAIRQQSTENLRVSEYSESRDIRDSGAAGQSIGAQTCYTLFYCITACGLLLTIPSLLCNGILKDGITEWIPSFLSERFGAAPASAALFVSVLPVINISGTYLGRWINNRFTRNEMTTGGILFIGSVICAFGLFLLDKFAPSGSGSIIPMALSVILFALITSFMLGANNMFLTFMPLKFASAGRSASVSGFLNACSYLAAALSGVLSGGILEASGWTMLIYFWIATAFIGIPLCFAGAKFWAKGRKKLD